MNFADSLKKWFYNNSSQAASSDARIPLLNADGTPKGSDTMYNIIGAMLVAQKEINNVDLNSFIDSGVYYTNSVDSVTNKPYDAAYNNILIVIRQPVGQRIVQIFFCINDMVGYYRIKSDNGWGIWKIIGA